jgi:hypothetical protein
VQAEDEVGDGGVDEGLRRGEGRGPASRGAHRTASG